ncbi:MAG: hypothetical protein ACRYFX_16290 [Janthinobacterium lividum]
MTFVTPCQAQAIPNSCELLVVSSQHQIIELHKPDYSLTATKTGWDLKILNPEFREAIRIMESPDISFCAAGEEVLARGNDVLSSAVPVGATAFYATQHGKIWRFANSVIDITLIRKVVRK